MLCVRLTGHSSFRARNFEGCCHKEIVFLRAGKVRAELESGLAEMSDQTLAERIAIRYHDRAFAFEYEA